VNVDLYTYFVTEVFNKDYNKVYFSLRYLYKMPKMGYIVKCLKHT